LRKCKNKDCGKKFKPQYNTTQNTCGYRCAIEKVKQDKVKAYRKETKAIKARVREHDKGWHIKTLQAVFNKFIRLRDSAEGCISCGTRKNLKYDAGHFRTVGAAPELRFCEENVHKQCSYLCNQTRTGNVTEYRIGLLKKIGEERLAWLEGPHEPKKYTIPELQEMIKDYRARIRRTEKDAQI